MNMETGYNIYWCEICTPEEADCGCYEEGCDSFDNYEEALSLFNRLKKNDRLNITFTKDTTETLFHIDAKCNHVIQEKYDVKYGEDKYGEYLIYTSRCSECGMIEKKDKIYIQHV